MQVSIMQFLWSNFISAEYTFSPVYLALPSQNTVAFCLYGFFYYKQKVAADCVSFFIKTCSNMQLICFAKSWETFRWTTISFVSLVLVSYGLANGFKLLTLMQIIALGEKYSLFCLMDMNTITKTVQQYSSVSLCLFLSLYEYIQSFLSVTNILFLDSQKQKLLTEAMRS